MIVRSRISNLKKELFYGIIIMKKTTYSLGLKSISLILSGLLVIQSTAPAFAEVPVNNFEGSISVDMGSYENNDLDAKLGDVYSREANSENEFEKAFKREIQRQISAITPLAKEMSAYRETGKSRYKNNYIAYAGLAGANTIKQLTYQLKEFMGSMFIEPQVLPFEDFEKEYNEYIKKEAEEYVKANKSSLSFQTKDALGNYMMKQINVDMMISALKKELPAKTLYKDYVANANKEIKWFKENKKTINEGYYKVLREYVKAFGPENISFEAAKLLGNLKLNGNPVILPSEKTSVYNYVVSRLNNEDLKSVFDISLFSSSSTKDAKIKVAGQKLQDLADLMIIGAYMAPSDNSDYADAVVNLINKSFDTIAFPHILNAGFGSLLALKRYDKLDEILDKYTGIENREDKTSFGRILEDISFESLADSLSMTNKFLRGKASQAAQYQNKYAFRNAFEDIARTLAADNSADSLNLLKKYGVDKGNSAIPPFLVGALETKKSGADASHVKYFKDNSLSPAAILAFRIANSTMDDLTSTQEFDLDVSLINAYPEIASKAEESKGVINNEDKKAFKEKNYKGTQRWHRAGVASDIGFMVWATFDIANLAMKAASFSKAMYISIKVLNIANPAARSAAIMKNLPSVNKYIKARNSLRAFSGKIKGSMAGVVLSQRSLYTAEALPKIAGAGAENTATAKALGAVTLNAAGDGLKLDKAAAYVATAGETGRVTEITKLEKTLDIANNTAKEKYLNRSFFNKYKNYSSYLSEATQDAFRSQGYTGYSLEAGLDFGYSLKGSTALKAPTLNVAKGTEGGINWVARPLSAAAPKVGAVELSYRASAGSEVIPLPVNVSFVDKIPGIKVNKVSRVLLTGNDDNKMILSVLHGEKIMDPAFFKIGINNDTFANLAKMSLISSKPLNVKFMARGPKWSDKVVQFGREIFAKKEDLFSGTGSVFVRDAAGNLKSSSIKLLTPKEYDGVKVVVENANRISVVGRNSLGEFTHFKTTTPYMFALPKGELPKFIEYTKGASFQNPLEISLAGGRNKIKSLFFIQFLSLSAASTGLVGPLRDSYGDDMSEFTASLIAVGLPYASSFLSPVWAPFVKRIGSANMMKVSLGLAAGSLLVPTITGFNGKNDISKYNDHKPSYTPLIASATLIGLSSSITRASFNPLMDAIGGGGGQFKSFMFKNLSGYAMLVPPLAFSIKDLRSPEYRTNNDGSLMLDEKGERILKPHKDAFTYNPVLLGVTGYVFLKFQTARIPTSIGLVKDYKISSPKFLLQETGKAYKTVVRREVLPYTLAATGALGVEASMFNKYGNAESKEYADQGLNYLNEHYSLFKSLEPLKPSFKPLIAMAFISLPQMGVRAGSKKILKAFGGDNPLGYKRLTTASLLTAGAGVGLLSFEDPSNNPGLFYLGAGLVGVGFANTTTGFKMLGQTRLKELGLGKDVWTEWNVGYPAVHLGMALVPMLHNKVADMDREKDPSISKNESLQQNIWIPALALGASGYFYSKGIGALKTGQLSKFMAPLGHSAAVAFPIGRGLHYMDNNTFKYEPVLETPTLQAPKFDFSGNTLNGNTNTVSLGSTCPLNEEEK